MKHAKRVLLLLVFAYFNWLGMLAVHELGHIAAAWFTGGQVIHVSFPLLGFSQTFVDPNPHPLPVVWGGPICGVLLPSLILLFVLIVRRKAPAAIWFFTGFCLISNGAYIGLGWMKHSGDAHDLLREGAPLVTLITFGAVCLTAGFVCWHQIPSQQWRIN